MMLTVQSSINSGMWSPYGATQNWRLTELLTPFIPATQVTGNNTTERVAIPVHTVYGIPTQNLPAVANGLT
ncbi:hypothetical protein BaRGS_00001025 [Batillaria attramentaria]|uniref:Uncharacterized protein n=1 Tax=Batillaria attramentaria TaxID=370345 RepID=A0ABD0M8H2_9CAEN